MITSTEFTMYNRYTDEQLTRMGAIFYSGNANSWQAKKYNFICESLLSELRQLDPTAKPHTAVYLQAAISAALRSANEQEKNELARMRANAQNAHNNLLNFDLAAKAKERN